MKRFFGAGWMLAAACAFWAQAAAGAGINYESGWTQNLAGWKFHLGQLENGQSASLDDSQGEQVYLPHTLELEPRTYGPGKSYYRGVGWYRTSFSIPPAAEADNIIVEFDGAMAVAEVWLNGEYLGNHLGGFTPFAFELSGKAKIGQPNLLAVKVDNRRMEVPPDGLKADIDYPLYGGLYRAVRVIGREKIFVEDIFINTPEVSKASATIKTSLKIQNTLGTAVSFRILSRVFTKDGSPNLLETKSEALTAEAGKEISLTQQGVIENPALWSPDHPNLYRLQVSILDPAGKAIGSASTRFGIRSFRFTPDRGFFLNGEPLKLIGFNRHQFYPYLGNAVPDRYQRFDAELIKNSGANFVRLSHYPQSPAFLDACDELGLMVYEELPGWHYLGDEKWKGLAEQALREMILRDRNRPSVILWGVRINESKDDPPFNNRLNAVAHELDPTRPTTGARMVGNWSNYFEDVLSLNDYTVTGIEVPLDKPFLLSETVGVNYQASRGAKPNRVRTYVEWHLFLLNQVFADPRNSGEATWCIADHVSFQIGGGIVALQLAVFKNLWHWGVVDAFRIPKETFYVFLSQLRTEPFVHILGNWDENAMRKVMVLHNCDQVELVLNGRSLGKQGPDKFLYPNNWIKNESRVTSLIWGKSGVKPVKSELPYSLPHPPATFENVRYEPGELSARCLVRGNVVADHTLRTPGKPDRFVLEPDYSEILADGSDMTRVVVKLVDANGTALSNSEASFKINSSGPARILSDRNPKLEAGQSAFFVQSSSLEPGEVKVKVSGAGGEATAENTIKVVAP